jgi:uncharacterized protein (TIGR03437 family)
MHRFGLVTFGVAAVVCAAFAQPSRQAVSLAASFATTRTVAPPSLAVDRAGNIYLAGQADSRDLPQSAVGFHTQAGQGCAFILKLNPDASRVEYASYFGCFGTQVNSIAVDSTGSAYVTGMTFATSDFPILNPIAPRQKTSDDAFILKLSPDGSSLVYSTTIGGSQNDQGNAIALGSDGSAYVTGSTDSGDFPVRSALQTASGSPPVNCGLFGCQTTSDAFVVKLAANGSLAYSTYLGGRGVDVGRGIAVDSSGNAYVTGDTDSANFPLRAGAYIGSCAPVPSLQCGTSAFAAKVNSAGNALVYSTLLAHGGSRGIAIAVDSAQNAYIAGVGLVPPTVPSDPCDNNCTFIAKLSQDGAALLYSLDMDDEGGRAIVLDSESNIYVTGNSLMGDAMAVRIARTGGPPFRTYLGPGYGSGIAINPAGRMIVAGYGLSGSFPTTPGAVQASTCGFDYCGYIFVAGMDVISQPPLSTPQLSPNGLVNAASLEPGPVAPGEIVTVFGTNFGPADIVIAQPDSHGRLPRSLAGTSLNFGDFEQAPLLYVAPGQLSAIVPYSVAHYDHVSVVVDYQGIKSRPQNWVAAVADASPAIFTRTQSGSGPGAILNQDGRLNDLPYPAPPGSIIVIYATGEGATDPQNNAMLMNVNPAPKPSLPVKVRIGGIDAEVLYAGGVAGQVPGLLQVNARIPETVPPGETPIELIVGSYASNSRTIVFVGTPTR